MSANMGPNGKTSSATKKRDSAPNLTIQPTSPAPHLGTLGTDLPSTLENTHITSDTDHYDSPRDSGFNESDGDKTGSGYESDGDNFGPVFFPKEERELYRQRKEEEINGLDQKHLDILYKAYRSLPPSNFAFGDVISTKDLDPDKLVVQVHKKGSPRKITPQKLAPVKKSKKNKKGRTKHSNSGSSEDDDERPPVAPTQSGEPGLDLTFPISADALKSLIPFTTISSFGKGRKTETDLSIRNSSEIKPDGFTLKPNPITRSDILKQIASRLNRRCNFRADIAKLNVYSTGGFFKSHWDTPRGTDHVGTLVIGLPSTYEGGALVVKHAGKEIRFDWGREATRYKFATPQLHWAFLYGDCEHEVEEVTRGSRLTLAYDIYIDSRPDNKSNRADFQSDQLASKLKDALKDREGFAAGCTLAFGLGHSYPKTLDVGHEKTFWRHFEHRLKGTDATLLEAVKKCNLKFSFKAAFPRKMNHFDHPKDEMSIFAELRDLVRSNEQALNQLSSLRVRNGLRKYEVILADRPDQLEGGEDNEFDGREGPTTVDRLEIETKDGPMNLVWVDYPTDYSFQNTYIFAGNDAGDEVVAYSGVALLVQIPPAAHR